MKTEFSSAKAVSLASVTADCALAGVKLIIGGLSGSQALFSDGIHSCADVFSSLVVLVGSFLSRSEKLHRISPKKIEAVSLIVLSFLLCTTGLFIGVSAFRGILNPYTENSNAPSVYALAVSALSLFIKESMFFITRHVAVKENDDVLLANAWHHQSDALSCISSFVGIVMSRLGFLKFDYVAGLFISVFIIFTGADIFKKAILRLKQGYGFDDSINKMYKSNKNFIENLRKPIDLNSKDDII